MKNQLLDYGILKEKISKSNVLAMAELIALSEIRYLMGHMGHWMRTMYVDLYADMVHKNELGHTFSDSYDLVQEGALFLCGHYGNHLSDVIGYSKSRKPITIRIACSRQMTKLVNRKYRDAARNTSFEALTRADEPSCEIREETTQDYTQYDEILESLHLTENMRVALECRIKGLSFPEIGRVLSRAQSTVFEYFLKMRQRYTTIYS